MVKVDVDMVTLQSEIVTLETEKIQLEADIPILKKEYKKQYQKILKKQRLQYQRKR
jgi:hypothetical protein